MNKSKPENLCTVVHDTYKEDVLVVPNMIEGNIRFKKLLPILFVVGLIINITVISLIVSKEVKKETPSPNEMLTQPPLYALSVGPSSMSPSSPTDDNNDDMMGPAEVKSDGTLKSDDKYTDYKDGEINDPPEAENEPSSGDRKNGKKNISLTYYSLLSVGILLMVPHVIPLVTSKRNITKNKNSMAEREIVENRTSEMEDGCIVEDCDSLG